MPDAGLSVEGLAVSFGAARVLTEVSLEVGQGEIVGLVGPNGAGKTTTLRAISGIARRRAGRLAIADLPLPARAAKVASLGIAHVPEGRGLVPTLSVRDNLKLACAATGRPFGSDQSEEACMTFPALEPLFDKAAGLLSGGEAQMVAVARGMVTRPRILMVDELSLGLAPKVVRDLLAALVAYVQNHGVGLLLVDQNARALVSSCDRVYSLRQGRTALLEGNHGDDALRSLYFDY